MQIILLEKFNNLGDIGDKIKVKSGYARNFLIPKGKALLYTEKNIQFVKNKIDAMNLKIQLNIKEAQEKASKIKNLKEIIILAKVGKDNKLFGSVNNLKIIESIKNKIDVEIKKNEVILENGSLKTSGKHLVKIKFHQKVIVNIIINIQSIK